jgi:hypothetical protein
MNSILSDDNNSSIDDYYLFGKQWIGKSDAEKLSSDQPGKSPAEIARAHISIRENRGRCYIATKNYAPGDLILDEEPYCMVTSNLYEQVH